MDAGQVSDLDDGRCAGVGEEGVFGGGGGEGSCLADWGGGREEVGGDADRGGVQGC